MYEKEYITIRNVTLTAKFPLYLADGSAIFMQDTKLITKTRQLTNVFPVVAGLHLQQRSDYSMLFTANQSMISIQDYNDQNKLSAFLSQGCKYFFSLSLVVNSGSAQLQIICTYKGGANLNEEFVINQIRLHANEQTYKKKLQKPLIFKGTDKKVLNMFQSSNQQKQTNNIRLIWE